MAIIRSEVISRLKAGETIFHTLPKGDCEAEQPIQYLSGGGASYTCHLRARKAKPDICFCWPI